MASLDKPETWVLFLMHLSGWLLTVKPTRLVTAASSAELHSMHLMLVCSPYVSNPVKYLFPTSNDVHVADNGSTIYLTGRTEPDLESITPEVSNLFHRQLAGDNTTMVTNYSSWTPQVCFLT